MSKRAREKSVLSKQEIAVRRKALSQKKLKSSGTGRRAIVGVLLVALSVMALLSVATFDIADRLGPGFHNAVGPVGHAVAETLRGLFGVCAFVLPVVGGWGAFVLLLGDREQRRWPQVVSFLLLLFSGSVLAQLSFTEDGSWAHSPGGFVGRELGGAMTALFSTVGTVVLVSALATVAFIVGTQFAFLRLCTWAWDKAQLAGVALKAWGTAFIEKQKEAMVARREAAEAAAEEEAAFLEQLEAEESELTEAEEVAAEAAAVADEADRLKHEAELVRLGRMTEKDRAQAERERALVEKEAARLAKEALKTAKTHHKEQRAQSALVLAPTLINAAHANAPIDEGPLSGDPAWAFALDQGTPQSAAHVSAPPLPRRVPNIVQAGQQPGLPPPPPADAHASLPPTSASLVGGALGESLAAALPGPVDSAMALAPAAAQAAALAAPIAVGAVLLNGGRVPLIVEPKAPPKPTAKKEQKDFELFGGRSSFMVPPIDTLEQRETTRNALDKDAFLSTAQKLTEKLADFSINGEVVEIRPGPVVTMYEFKPAPGVKISKIASLADDLAMAMEAMRVRIVAPIPGKGVVGIEVPNKDRELVFLKEIAEQDAFGKSNSRLTMCLGKDVDGMPYVLDLGKAPHLLIAGTTGSGKSVGVNSMIMSILLKSTPDEVRFLMVDPKSVELSIYDGIPHLLLPVVTDMRKAAVALQWAVDEMERRYKSFADCGVRHLAGYNELVEKELKASKATVAGKVVKGAKKPSEALAEPAETETPEAAAPTVEAKAPAAPGKKKRRMLIVDVAAEGEVTPPSGTPAATSSSLGVAAPEDNAPGEIREASGEEEESLSQEVEADLKADITEGEIRVADADDESGRDFDLDGEPVKVPEVKTDGKKMSYIVVIIDELADLMMVAAKEVETSIARLAQKARAAGIHLIVATQRPSVDVVTGVIKANFPTRISFMLRNRIDSSTIIDQPGAEKLLGNGDMLILPPNSPHLTRVHGCYVSETEIKRVADHLRAQGKPVYDESILKPREEEGGGEAPEDDLSDELYDQAIQIVSEMKTVSISMLQRKMRIGYNRSARMIERMERDGLVGAADGAKPREVLVRAVGEMPGAGAY